MLMLLLSSILFFLWEKLDLRRLLVKVKMWRKQMYSYIFAPNKSKTTKTLSPELVGVKKAKWLFEIISYQRKVKNENLSLIFVGVSKDVKKSKRLFKIFLRQKVVKNYNYCRILLLKNLLSFTWKYILDYTLKYFFQLVCREFLLFIHHQKKTKIYKIIY